MLAGQLRRDLRETHDRQPVADLAQVGGRTVQLDYLRSRTAVDKIGLEPLAVVDVAHQDFLVGQEAGELGQVFRETVRLPS